MWDDVKPEHFVIPGKRLVAVDFGSACVVGGSAAQRDLGVEADTSFTVTPSDQSAWSGQYAAPERPRKDGLGWSPLRCSTESGRWGRLGYTSVLHFGQLGYTACGENDGNMVVRLPVKASVRRVEYDE